MHRSPALGSQQIGEALVQLILALVIERGEGVDRAAALVKAGIGVLDAGAGRALEIGRIEVEAVDADDDLLLLSLALLFSPSARSDVSGNMS